MGREPAFIVKVKVPASTKGSWFVTYQKRGKMIVIKRENIKSVYTVLKRKVMDYVASSNGGKTGVSVFYPIDIGMNQNHHLIR